MAGLGEGLDVIQVGLKRYLAPGADDIAGIHLGDVQTPFGCLPELIRGSLNKKDGIDIPDNGCFSPSDFK
jgi:hypothetical protein